MTCLYKNYMAETRNNTVDFELGGRVYPLSLTLGAIAEIQRRRGDITEAFGQALDSFDALIDIFALIFNDAIEDHNEGHPEDKWPLFDGKRLARKLTYEDVPRLTNALLALMGQGLPDAGAKGAAVTDEMAEALNAEALPEEPEKNGTAGNA